MGGWCNLNLGAPLKTSSWRKIAMGTWNSGGDPSVYGSTEVRAAPILEFLAQERERTGEHITLTHFIVKVVGEILARHPEINTVLRFGKFYPRKEANVFFQVASDQSGSDLSGRVVRCVNEKSLAEIAGESNKGVKEIREKGDLDYRKSKDLLGLLPERLGGLIARPLLKAMGFLLYTLNLWLPFLGVPRDPFGGAMVTNVGPLGVEAGFAPLVPYSRVPLLVAVGATKLRPVVVDDQVVPGEVFQLAVTFDHRYVDGVHAARMYKTLTGFLENPGSVSQ